MKKRASSRQKTFGPEAVPDPVVDRVADDRRRGQAQDEPADLEGLQGGEGPRREEQGVAGQERHDDEARLDEDDHEEDGVGPEAVLLDDGAEVPVEVQGDVEDLLEEIHESPTIPAPAGGINYDKIAP